MLLEGGAADYCHGLVGGKEVAVVVEDGHVQGYDQAVGGVAGYYVDLLFFQGAVEEAQVHDFGVAGEGQAVGVGQAAIAVGALHEFVAEAGAPLGGRGERGRRWCGG